MDWRIIVLALVVAAGTVFAIVQWVRSPPTSSVITITDKIKDGKTQYDSNITIPRSFNQDPGAAFSYACWVKVNTFNYRYGEAKAIFNKGPADLSSMCPALFLDSTSNSLIVKLDTFGSTEVIPIGNIPAQKWIHVAIAVSQDAMDIYINGTLYLHHTLVNLPKQNSDTVHTGIAGGFDGQLASLRYYPYLLEPSSIASIMASTPQADPATSGTLPPYFGTSFWVNH
jgi:hypothetical protein